MSIFSSWHGFSGTNYTNNWALSYLSSDGDSHCFNSTLNVMMSLRYSGPADVSTPSISIYGGNPGTITGGVERTFTSLAATNFGFVPTWMVLTGRSS